MKVNVEVTCTPEEARAFFGLPDLGTDAAARAGRDRGAAALEASTP